MNDSGFKNEGKIINFPKKTLDIDSIVKKTQDALSSQKDVETFIKDKIKILRKKGKINNNKLASPTLLSQFDDVSTVESIILSLPMYNQNKKDGTKTESFAIEILQKHYYDIEKSIKEHIDDVKKLFDIAKSAPSPRYAERIINYETHEGENALKFIEKFK